MAFGYAVNAKLVVLCLVNGTVATPKRNLIVTVLSLHAPEQAASSFGSRGLIFLPERARLVMERQAWLDGIAGIVTIAVSNAKRSFQR